MEDLKTIETVDQKPFKYMCMTIGELPASFVDSMTYYECLAWLVNYLEKQVVPAVNNNAIALRELQEYVEHYFDNLDVQEEINNKLDEMVESGEFQELVGEYLVYKEDYYEITDQTESKVAEILASERKTYIRFMNDYTFNSLKRIKGEKTIDLNNKTITFNVPSVVDNPIDCHGFFNFETTDEFTGYDGNSNICIKNGTIIGGNLSFCHAKNITVTNVRFSKCKNNHILEMCAIDGLNVENCSFEGIPYGSTGEYIQNDAAIAEAFPWFDQENPTYDGTVCKNFSIKSCTFKPSTDLNYIHDCSIGTHAGATTDDYTENFVIEECTFKNAKRYAIQIYNAEKLCVRNCVFDTDSTEEESCNIRLRSNVKNCVIENNKFTGATRSIQTASPNGSIESLNIINNEFTGYNSALYSAYPIVVINESKYLNISGNIFEDFSQYGITILKSNAYDSNIDYTAYIENNTFYPKHKIPGGITVFAGKAYILNNTFDCTGYNPDGNAISVRNTASGLVAKNNTFTANIVNIVRDIDDFSPSAYKEAYGMMKKYWEGNSTSVTITSDTFAIGNFNRMYLTIGSTANVQTIEIIPYNKQGKLEAQTWGFVIATGNGVVSRATLQLNASNELIYTGSESLRRVYVTNVQ